MKPERTETYRALVTELERFGVTNYFLDRGTKHPRVVFHHQGKVLAIPFPMQADDWRILNNIRAQVRHVLGVRHQDAVVSTEHLKRRTLADLEAEAKAAAARKAHSSMPPVEPPVTVAMVEEVLRDVAKLIPVNLEFILPPDLALDILAGPMGVQPVWAKDPLEILPKMKE